MQTERKYKIDKYIELARLTKSADKKEEFIDWAHYYLELSEAEFEGKEPYQAKIPYLDGKEKNEFLHKPTRECYDEYVKYCKTIGEQPVIHAMFSREVNKLFDMRTGSKKIGSEVRKCFLEGAKK